MLKLTSCHVWCKILSSALPGYPEIWNCLFLFSDEKVSTQGFKNLTSLATNRTDKGSVPTIHYSQDCSYHASVINAAESQDLIWLADIFNYFNLFFMLRRVKTLKGWNG